jgi:hypothetical protein
VLATQVGQTVGVSWLPGVLPLGSYSFAVAKIDRRPQIDQHLAAINELSGLTAKQSKRIRKLTGERIVKPGTDAGTAALEQLKMDCEAANPVLKLATATAAQRELGLTIKPGEFGLRIEQINDHEWRSESTLQRQFDLTNEQVHEVVQRGLLGVGQLNLRLEQMETYSALSGFRRNEIPLIDEKLRFLARQLDPETQEQRFDRVVSLVGLPDVDPDPGVSDVDLRRLLEITVDPKVVAFRHWIRGIDVLDDDEVASEIRKIRDMLGEAVRSKAGKAVRFGVTAASELWCRQPESCSGPSTHSQPRRSFQGPALLPS